MSVKKLRWLLPLMLITLCAGLILPAQAAPTFVINLGSDKITLNVDEKKLIDYTVTASSDVEDKTLTFDSDNKSVVTVSSSGELTGVGVGYANVTIAHESTPKVSVVVKVEVLSTSTLTLDLYSATLPEKGSVTLTYHTNAPLPITFSTSNPAVCTVDSAGKVTAVGPGTAEILVANSHGVKASCMITVSGSGSPAPSTPSNPATPSAPAEGYTAYVNTASGSLNLRAAQTTDAIILRTIPQNAAFTVLEYGPVWCKAWYNGTTGYVMTKFVRFAGTTPATPTTPVTPTTPT
ncbi:MAG: Ig domain-containing protein, partial [Clostridia bacterium]|nr:Ig domain-containing protein [Clostridia bacterium]